MISVFTENVLVLAALQYSVFFFNYFFRFIKPVAEIVFEM
tara:strand:+ start:761 stop:880 length:120 start_codon:yes stop_codon:yes gene_type:complete